MGWMIYGSQFLRGERGFSLLYEVQTGPLTDPLSYSMGPGDLSSGYKVAGV